MASDPVDHHHLHPSDAASSAEHPSSSSSPTAGHRKVKLLCSYGGQILPRAGDGSLRYVGGETRIVTLRRDATLPEVLRKMGDLYGVPALLRYQLPDQDLDPLISVSTSDDLENMMEEYDKLTADTPGGKLRVFLFPHNKVAGTGADSVAPYCALQENVTRYLDAINGLDSGIRGRDSATSFSSAHNSDGMNVSEAAINESVGMDMVNNEGTFHANMCPTTISAQDALNMAFGMEENQHVQKAYSHSNQTEVLHSIQSEWSPPGLNQNSIPNSTQAEQPSVAWHMPQFYGDSRHAQMSPQYYAVMGIPPPINVAGASQHTYVPPGHINATNETTNHPRVDPHFGNPNVGNVAKFPSDVNHHLFPQLPPLPSPHLLAPNAERNALRQVGTSSQVLTKRLDCSLCQTSLPHAHSETIISEQGIGLKTTIPEATKVFQSRHSEDLTRMRATQVPDVGMPVIKGMDTQVENLTAAPPKAYDFIETAPQMSQDCGRPVVDAASADMAEILIAPVSLGILSASQPSTGTINNPQQSNEVHSLQKQQEGPTLVMNSDSYGHPKILLGPGSVSITQNPSGTFIIPPQSNVGDILQHQTQLLQHIGLNVFPMYPVDQDFNNKSFVLDTGLVGKSEHQTDGQTMHGSETTFFHSHARPIDMTMGAVWKNPHGFPGFCDQTRPVGGPDVDTSKYVKPEQPTMVTVNTHKNGLQERGNELSVSHPLISNVAVPEGNSVLAVQPSMVSDVAYLQSVHPANTSLIPDTIEVHGPYLNHLEAGVGSRGVANYADPAYISNDFSKNPNVERKDETSNFHAVDVPIEKAIPQRDNSQFSTMHHTNKMDQLQQVFLTGSHASDKDLQNAQGATVLPPRPNNVSKKEAISTKDMHSSICPKNNKQSEIVVPTEFASSNIQNSQNMDSPKELAYTLKDLEDVNIKQDIQIYDGRASATTLQPSEVQVPVPDSYETKDTSPDKECATKESNIAVECDHTENIKNKQLEKIKNGFPNTDEIGHHLQIIKNSDLEELQELGSGTFGTVYHGKWRGSDVAIKRINDRIFSGKPSEQERARADFWNEACKLASLHHPNVVAFYGIVLDGPGGSIATVTEFMVNGSLRRALQKNEKLLDRHKRLLIAMDVAFGMEYLHSKNIIHFDLKSDNLLVNLRDPQRPICKVGDLGLSKVKYETLMSGGMQGTLPWMAPELLLGKDSKYTEKVDVFSFGIVMWELLTGEEPYKGMHCGAIIGGILSDTLRPPVPETCDPDWRSLMEQCWATEPSLRPSFTEIASRLRTMSTSLPQKA